MGGLVSVSLSIKIAAGAFRKIGSSLGPEALKYESFEGKGFFAGYRRPETAGCMYLKLQVAFPSDV